MLIIKNCNASIPCLQKCSIRWLCTDEPHKDGRNMLGRPSLMSESTMLSSTAKSNLIWRGQPNMQTPSAYMSYIVFIHCSTSPQHKICPSIYARVNFDSPLHQLVRHMLHILKKEMIALKNVKCH